MIEPEEQAPKPKVSVLVVSYNRIGLLRRCLEALERSESRSDMQVLVVDNGSTDGSPDLESEFPNMRFIRVPKNFGLTKALNFGVRAAEGEYVFLLHEDTEVSPETVKELAARLDADADSTAVAPMLVTPRGNPAPQLGHFPPDGHWRPVFDAGQAGMPANPPPVSVDYARGAALMVRMFFLRAMHQIDERYGQFGGDADICYQIRRAGKKVLVLPALRTQHHGGPDSALRQADLLSGCAVWIGKYQGLPAGLWARVRFVLMAVLTLRLGRAKYLISGQKIDGTQN